MGVIEVWAVFARVPNRVVSNLCFHCRSAKRSVCEGGGVVGGCAQAAKPFWGMLMALWGEQMVV